MKEELRITNLPIKVTSLMESQVAGLESDDNWMMNNLINCIENAENKDEGWG